MNRLILMRHGESLWNRFNVFTGWVDVPLSPKGIDEALAAGKVLSNIPIDLIYTSTLVRGSMTAFLAMAGHGSGKVPVVMHPESSQLQAWGTIHDPHMMDKIIPVYEAWELNERMYGELQGLNKAETAAKFGAHQVQVWRRSFNVAPPAGESLEMTAARTLPYFKETIVPQLEKGKNILISAHGNSLRSIMMMLDGLSEEAVVGLEIPTGIPIIYSFSHGQFKKVTQS